MASGVRLGWLLDPLQQRAYIYRYRPGKDAEVLENPHAIFGGPELPGFVLESGKLWGSYPPPDETRPRFFPNLAKGAGLLPTCG